MIVIASKYLVPKGYAAIAIYPFVILGTKSMSSDTTLLNHEKIHLRQQAELLILPFYLWYVFEYLIRMVKYRNHIKAYKNISFEREAYANEKNSNYLYNRPIWRFTKYL